jgi:predicted  nucleic acid-binding Zn-ribbon protein
MATRSAIYEMDKVEQNRLRLVTSRLAKRLNLPDVATPERARQPELQRVFELRVFNDFLEGLDAAIKDEGYTAAAGESKADQAKAAEAEADTDAAPAVAEPVRTKSTVAKTTKAKA